MKKKTKALIRLMDKGTGASVSVPFVYRKIKKGAPCLPDERPFRPDAGESRSIRSVFPRAVLRKSGACDMMQKERAGKRGGFPMTVRTETKP